MIIRSTGLGKTELKCDVRDIREIKKDVFLVNVDTIDPVRWHVRVVVEPKDLNKMIPQLIKPTSILGIFKMLIFRRKPVPKDQW